MLYYMLPNIFLFGRQSGYRDSNPVLLHGKQSGLNPYTIAAKVVLIVKEHRVDIINPLSVGTLGVEPRLLLYQSSVQSRYTMRRNFQVPRQGIEPCIIRLKAGGFTIVASGAYYSGSAGS